MKLPVDSDQRFLIACMPKSGSTFLSAILAQLPGMRREHLVPGYERREQELCPQRLNEAAKRTATLRQYWRHRNLPPRECPCGYVAQHHVRYSSTTAIFIKNHNLKTVVLVRDIFDVIPSLYDHIINERPYMSMAFVDDHFHQFNKEQAYEFLVEFAIPWYFNFYVSWTHAPDCLFISYDEVMRDAVGSITHIYRHFKLDVDPVSVADALKKTENINTRKNKGVAGRGTSLPFDIRNKIEHYASFYRNVDFSLIGLQKTDEKEKV